MTDISENSSSEFAGLFYLCRMTDPEIIAYFNDKTMPQTLRIDRATTQHEVKEAVSRNIEILLNDYIDCARPFLPSSTS